MTSNGLLKLFTALFYSTNALLIPYLPLLLSDRGFDSLEVGTLLMLGPFLAMFAQPIVGVWSDRIKATKPLLYGLWIAKGLAAACLFLSTGRMMAAVSLLVLYICFLPAVTLLDTLSVKTAAAANTSYSDIRLWGSVGFTITALVLGQYFDLWGGVDSLMWMYLPIWGGLLIGMFLLKEPKVEPTAGTEPAISWKVVRQALSMPSLLIFFGLIFLVAMPHRMNDGLLSLHLSDLGASTAQVSWAWAVAGLSEIIGFAVMGRIMRRDRMLVMLTVVSFLYVGRWLLYAFVTDPWVVIALQFAHAFTYVALWVVAIEFVSNVLPQQLAATGQALLGMVFLGLAGLAGGAAGGALQEAYGGTAMYLFGAVCAALGAVGFLIWRFFREKASEKLMPNAK
ncbi:MFS transporter [Paenibacillus sp. 481]|uniref:MFS transporter n=1 Tax=Paenibacillus sp. 481 TaxID=2835869 RepID=UPI001E37C88F|nr:MFS transporter [Paenibacillus sp. 481]UHA74650.1 MFS transporter [Paenibacillus sp. 481]